jgi:hypothetical protein
MDFGDASYARMCARALLSLGLKSTDAPKNTRLQPEYRILNVRGSSSE